MKKETGNNNRACAAGKHKLEVNPLKKYAPMDVPGWEVNIIYKPSRNTKIRVPVHTNVNRKVAPEVPVNTSDAVESSDVAKLVDNLEVRKEILGDAGRKKGDKSVFWKPVFAVQKLMKRVKGTGGK